MLDRRSLRGTRLTRTLGTLAVTAVAGGLIPAGADANVRIPFPSESPGAPFYARAEADGVIQDDGWAAIAFYRDPACVPANFNLLQFFDVPGAFGCALTIAGFEIWQNGPGLDPAPIQVNSHGTGAVPIWFVSVSELTAAMADGVLTITELAALPSRQIGYADQFREVLHPSETGRNAKLTMTASGELTDGRSFRLQFSAAANRQRHTRIVIG